MNYQQALEYIHSLGMFSHPPGLNRITAALEKLENPQNNFKSIHIAGTNGKGSTAAFCASALQASGFKTGFFTSPYIIDFRDRIRINGEFIPESDVVSLCKRVIETKVTLTEFEFITAMGLLCFSEQKVDFAVIEVGLGGRFDATNAIPAPEVSVITKIGLDHTAILGNIIAEIAREKCGIIKNDITVTSPNQENKALEVIKCHASKLIIPELSELKIIKCTQSGNEFYYKGKLYSTRLSGIHQVYNAVTAIEALNHINISNEAISEGLKCAFMPARLELIRQSPTVLLDGAHNPDGAEALSHFMKETGGRITAIIGMVRDKDYQEFLARTLPHCSSVITVKAADIPRALEASELATAAKRCCDDVSIAADYNDAIKIAAQKAGNNPIFVFGSLYLASGIRPALYEFFK